MSANQITKLREEKDWVPPPGAKRYVNSKTGATVWRDAKGRILKGALNPNGAPVMSPDVKFAICDNGEKAVEIMSGFLHDPTAFGQSGWMDQKIQMRLLEVAVERAFGKPDSPKAEAIRVGAAASVAEAFTAVYENIKDDLPEFRGAKADGSGKVVDVTPSDDDADEAS